MALDEVSTKSKRKYHVFLSFRGEDTRFKFTDHLYKGLERKGIITFRDDEELERGEVISQNLLKAIEESVFAIVIISPNYASSTWCLDELQKIVDCKQSLGLEVFPIFYDVDPSHVRHQMGSFEQAFNDHQNFFVGDKEKVQKWRDALKDVANIAGWESKDTHESELIEAIVEKVWTKLEPKLPTNTDGLVAIETKVNEFYSHLKLGLQNVHFIGIWGMGGIGKTTLAHNVYKRIKSQFDFSCFVANVREASNEGDQGLVKLQNKLLSHLKPKSIIIDSLYQGRDMVKNLLHNKKVLLVLDDVNAEIQLEYLAGNQNWFGPGSRIIVTTRDKHLLTTLGFSLDIYEMKILNDQESLILLCEKAFEGNQPLYLELSKKVVKYTGGLPLALKVFGSLLHGRSVKEWEETLNKMCQFPCTDILKQLKISYDMLEDEYKTIFLIFACFFKGWNKTNVTTILDCCGLHPTIGINVLIEKSLVTCDENLLLGMHDLLEDMGKHIVIQESPHDPGRRRWLWSLKDINNVLTKTMETEKVKGIFLNQIMSYDACWLPNAFSNMGNLGLLIIYGDLHLQHGLKCFSRSLNVLIWKGFPLKALSLGVQLDELVYLEMHHSKIKNLWIGTHFFGKLKYIDLKHSEDLIESPDISGVPNLTMLFLKGCINLVKVHHSVGQHKKLEKLSFSGCINLETLPTKMEMCSLKYLSLSHCLKLRRLPDFEEKMECVEEIQLRNCKNLLCLPNTISNLKSLKVLNMSGCLKVNRLPNNINENKALEELDLSYTSIREVNSSLFDLENLKRLLFQGCSGRGLIFKSQRNFLTPLRNFLWKSDQIMTAESLILPPFISNLSSLIILNLRDCNLKSLPDGIGHLPSLERLDLSENANLTLDLACIANLPKLRCLDFDGNMCGPRTLLPTHVRIYPEDSIAEANIVDGSKLWKLFKSCCPEDECVEDCSPPCLLKVLVTRQRTINENISTYILSGPILSRQDSTAHIPNDCGMHAWWGVALFVVLDLPISSSLPLMTNSMYLTWRFKDEQDVFPSQIDFRFRVSTIANSNHYLVTMIMNDSISYIQRHQSGYYHNDESKKFVTFPHSNLGEQTRLEMHVKVEGRKIRKCWWYPLHKEDLRFVMFTKPTSRI